MHVSPALRSAATRVVLPRARSAGEYEKALHVRPPCVDLVERLGDNALEGNRLIPRTRLPMSFLLMSLRAIGIATVFLAGVGMADAQSTRVGKASVIGTGLYEIGESKAVE